MRPITLLGCSVLSLAATGCAGPHPEPIVEPPPIVEELHFTFTMSSPQNSNVGVGTYKLEAAGGGYNSSYGVGVSIISARSGTYSPNYTPCQTVNVRFEGKPAAGKQSQLLLDEDRGFPAPGTGTLAFLDTCSEAGKIRYWLSASGTLRIDSVAEPDPRMVPEGYPAGMLKMVKLTVVDATMVPAPDSGNTATGTFTLHGESVGLVSGMDQP
ncbi:hypothetical protein F0U61_23385 [Archangium violaceum]|uniref:hypothetical protein n=1 Tax=Archangium violaceum TaxID=83451 RepID=UPI002B2B3F7F|nr:hypothetical protein F0U61_23385 [Archangium violaceum]